MNNPNINPQDSKKSQTVKDKLAQLRAEIHKDVNNPGNTQNSDTSSSARDVLLKEIAEKKPEAVISSSDSELVSKIGDSEKLHREIMSDLGAAGLVEEKKDEKLAQNVDTSLGLERTYRRDVSHAMRSDNPKTVAELIERDKYKKERAEITSPTSTKNILYILGTAVIIILLFIVLAPFFEKKQELVFQDDQRVDSLIYSDFDTGVRLVGTDVSLKKQALRDATEEDVDTDQFNNIYYVKGGERAGFKDVNKDLGLRTPQEILDATQNNFMHGVYKSDKNYPFLILKTDQYGRSFAAMQKWEATIIEDLAPFLNLPEEALDRSLIQSGFQSDLIKNKNVRVARYIPRTVDGKDKLLDLLGITKVNETTLENKDSESEESNVSEDTSILQVFRSLFTKKAIAQNGAPDAGFPASNDSGLLSGADIGATDFNITDGVIGTDNVIDTLTRENVCFDRITGNRVNNDSYTSDAILTGSNLCFDSYICRRHTCWDTKTNREVPAQHAGDLKPGVSCETSPEKGYHCFETSTGNPVSILESRISPVGIRCGATDDIVDYSYLGPKECEELSWLLQAQNIKDKQLCFDETGTLIVDGRFGGQNGFCIDPISRKDKVCLDSQGKLHLASEASSNEQFEICFEPNESFALNVSTHGGLNITEADLAREFFETHVKFQEQALALHYKLSLIIASAHLFNLHDNNVVDTLKDAANLLLYISQGKLIEEEAFAKIALVIQDLDVLLEIVDPLGTVSSQVSDDEFSLVRELKLIIKILKQIIGGGNNLSWLTVGKRLDQYALKLDAPIGAKGAGPIVDFTQQMLVLTGSLSTESLSGELDLVTQDALEQFQELNGLTPTGVINQETFDLLELMATNGDSLYGDDIVGLINDYIDDGSVGFGTYSEDVQTLQIILYVRDYNISKINGILDSETCDALRDFQRDNDLEEADLNSCLLSTETIDYLNTIIREGSYLGSGFSEHEQGYLEGVGLFKGLFGPGVANFGISEAEAASLREGEIVLLYSFLDKNTILIATHPSVITEVIKRRNLNDIFNQK